MIFVIHICISVLILFPIPDRNIVQRCARVAGDFILAPVLTDVEIARGRLMIMDGSG